LGPAQGNGNDAPGTAAISAGTDPSPVRSAKRRRGQHRRADADADARFLSTGFFHDRRAERR
jgi:hypothetical protein